jgi:hypothetical protein
LDERIRNSLKERIQAVGWDDAKIAEALPITSESNLIASARAGTLEAVPPGQEVSFFRLLTFLGISRYVQTVP